MNGTWKTGFYYGNIKDGFTDLAPYGPKVTAATKAKIAAKRTPIVTARSTSSPGPLYDQRGQAARPEGQDGSRSPDLYAMDWLVKGVVGSAKG